MTDTQASQEEPSCHVLDFFYDKTDSCALTALINGVRFHIIIDADEFKKSDDKSLLQPYLDLLQAVRNEEEEADSAEEKNDHNNLHGVEAAVETSPEDSRESSNSLEDRDSAIDLTADQDKLSKDEVESKRRRAKTELQNWMLSAFGAETERLASGAQRAKRKTMYDWYYGRTNFFELRIHEGILVPQQLEESAELREQMVALVPRLLLPKYIQNMDVPWLKPNDIEVISEIHDPGPSHPGEVKVGGDIQFFKPVDPSQSEPTKREIKILKDIADVGLHDEISVPRLLGLVALPESKTEIMGILLTNIPNAQPLTKLLDSDVAEERRLKWADDSKSIVQSLHKHKIVWGDAKADNFMVDEKDELWIIDFGGSYTEGWVDPELSETKSGDRMGLEKIVDALVDPDENTFDPEDEDEDDGDYSPPSGNKKRKRSTDKECDGEEEISDSKPDRTYCYCDGISSGEMVACDGDHCLQEWFHLECLGLTSPPKSDTWYCKECTTVAKKDGVGADGSRNKRRWRKS
ncbi:hypothetical protein LTR84_004687 [Exophiala bonariae]|uniref:PHD-type domain-containing protein n=1 Tax=Exophiala bonariae TaxID=1690606 RepID=A0AAV9NR63_9EURO|nr:hypothetical protein LTR84_004687 [Exophiala bonariae]